MIWIVGRRRLTTLIEARDYIAQFVQIAHKRPRTGGSNCPSWYTTLLLTYPSCSRLTSSLSLTPGYALDETSFDYRMRLMGYVVNAGGPVAVLG